MENKLKPCPLCGLKVSLLSVDTRMRCIKEGLQKTHEAIIGCSCGLSFKKKWVEMPEKWEGYVCNNDDVYTAWNTRTEVKDDE